MSSVPCTYFRVSLRDCAIPSSRWVDFADFGLVGFRFFVRLVKMTRAFIYETTARLRCVQVFVKLYSVTYVPISCLSYMAIMCHHERGSKDIFCPHTETLACWRRAFLSLGPPDWTFFRLYVKVDFLTSTLICGLPMGTPWLLVSDDASIFFARKKRVNNKYLCDKWSRFPVFTYPRACMRSQQPNHLVFQNA
jgi:hypothetical protein